MARLYYATGAALAFDRLRAAAGEFRAGDMFERTALRRLVEDLIAEQAGLTRAVMTFAGIAQAGDSAEDARNAVSSWAALRPDRVQLAVRTIEEIEAAGAHWSFAKLTIASAALRELGQEAAAAGRRKAKA